jgi:dTDP-4-amino-4,6-dideoxygalactose transaminase
VSHTLTAEIVERNLTPHTRCVIPVHLYGRTAEVDRVVDVAHGRGICVVEDACQAHGAVYKDMRVGSIGDAGCFSFYPAKNLGAWGDGGAVVTNDPALADRVRLMRSHGERPRHRHLLCGTTARLDALQAAVLRVKLPLLDGWNEGRRLVAARLSELLAQSSIETPAPLPAGHDHVFHQYVIRSDRRDRLREHLDRAGVATTIHYPSPIHLTEAYGYLGITRGRLPVAERQATRICSLPIFPSMSASELERVVHAVRSFAGPP